MCEGLCTAGGAGVTAAVAAVEKTSVCGEVHDVLKDEHDDGPAGVRDVKEMVWKVLKEVAVQDGVSLVADAAR